MSSLGVVKMLRSVVCRKLVKLLNYMNVELVVVEHRKKEHRDCRDDGV